MRAGPVTGPLRRMDSNIAERKTFHCGLEDENVLRFEEEADLREERMVFCKPGSLRMSRRVEVKLA